MFSLDEGSLKQTIDTLNGELTNLAEDPETYPADIAATPTTRLLNMLAIHGRQLYNNLFVYRPENAWLVGKDKKKIQIVSTRLENNLPLEFLYDYNAPNPNAKLCAYAKKSLPTGQCDKACGGPKNKQNIVCPLGFWGLNRVIERHAYDGKRNLQGNTYGLKAASSTPREPLQVLDRALFAERTTEYRFRFALQMFPAVKPDVAITHLELCVLEQSDRTFDVVGVNVCDNE